MVKNKDMENLTIGLVVAAAVIVLLGAGVYFYYIRGGRPLPSFMSMFSGDESAGKSPVAHEPGEVVDEPIPSMYRPGEGVGSGRQKVFVTNKGLRTYEVDHNNVPIIQPK